MIYVAVFNPARPNRVDVVRMYDRPDDVPAGSVEVDNFATLGPAPFPAAELQVSGRTLYWHDTRTLDELKAARWEAIKAARDGFIDSHLPTPYGPFDCKPKDRQNITDAVALLQTLAGIGQHGQTVTFTTADNATVTLTLAQLTEVALLLGQRVQQAYAIGRAKRQAINEATTVAAVDAVTWGTT